MSFLGTPAGIFADSTLVMQVVALIILFIGIFQVKKKNFPKHFKMADIAVFLGILSFLWMSFSFINNFQFIVYNILVPGNLLVLIHLIIGLLALLGGIFFVFNRFLKKNRNSMRIIFLLWASALVLGIVLYAMFYLF